MPFDWAQGGESFDFAQGREPVENPELVEVVERLVEPFGIWDLPFDWAQGGELVENPELVEVVEPFGI